MNKIYNYILPSLKIGDEIKIVRAHEKVMEEFVGCHGPIVEISDPLLYIDCQGKLENGQDYFHQHHESFPIGEEGYSYELLSEWDL